MIGFFMFLKVNFLLLAYFQIPLNIDFLPNLLISSLYTTKVYIQNTINKEVKNLLIKNHSNTYNLLWLSHIPIKIKNLCNTFKTSIIRRYLDNQLQLLLHLQSLLRDHVLSLKYNQIINEFF